MRYIINITLASKESRKYLVDASEEDEAKERLLLRLHPDQRDTVKIDSIEIDPTSIIYENPFGIYNED